MEALTQFKINYSMQRGLLANEDGDSRCNLITLAAELFLLGGSLEGALQTLRGSDLEPRASPKLVLTATLCQTFICDDRKQMVCEFKHLAV